MSHFPCSRIFQSSAGAACLQDSATGSSNHSPTATLTCSSGSIELELSTCSIEQGSEPQESEDVRRYAPGMATRTSDTLHALCRNPAAIAVVVGAISSLLTESFLGGRWPILVAACLLAFGVLAVHEWKQAGRLRRDLLLPLLELEVAGREYAVRLTGGDGNAPAPALMWSRMAFRWFRDAGFKGQADILDAAIEPEYLDYAQKPIHNRKAEVERRALAVVEKVLWEVRVIRERIETRITRR